MHTAIKIYKGLIEPHFDYCRVVWDVLSQQLSEKLQKLQNCAARVITKSSYNTNSSYLLNSLSWDNLSVRRTKQKANLMYKCVNKLTPQIIFVTCLLRELCPLIFVMQVKNCGQRVHGKERCACNSSNIIPIVKFVFLLYMYSVYDCDQ